MTADATELLQSYRAGRLDPVVAVEECLQSLDHVGAELNVAITVLHDDARRSAAESARRWQRGSPRPLEGVPIGVKDVIAVAGHPTTGGSRLLAGYVPDEDAAVIERLRAAGAVFVAKLTTFAFANGDPVNVDYGVTHNPRDPARLAGGSSSGSASAVAAGCVPVALGTDTGGSIRLPAAYCGVAGLKPTFGRVSRFGVMPLAWTLDHVGPITNSVRDLRLLFALLAGEDARDPSTFGRAPVAAAPAHAGPSEVGSADTGSWRVGVPDTYFVDDLDTITSAAFSAALDTMVAAGARVMPVHIPDLDLVEPIGRTIISVEAASGHDAFRERIAEYDDLLGARLAAAALIPAVDYVKALRLRSVLQGHLEAAMMDIDVLATPTTPTIAPLLNTLTVETLSGTVPWLEVAARNTFPFNISGMPAVTVPLPNTALPVGLQLAAAPFGDALLLDVAEWFERQALNERQ